MAGMLQHGAYVVGTHYACACFQALDPIADWLHNCHGNKLSQYFKEIHEFPGPVAVLIGD